MQLILHNISENVDRCWETEPEREEGSSEEQALSPCAARKGITLILPNTHMHTHPLNFIYLFPTEVPQSGKILVIQIIHNKVADLDLHERIWLLVPDINGD